MRYLASLSLAWVVLAACGGDDDVGGTDAGRMDAAVSADAGPLMDVPRPDTGTADAGPQTVTVSGRILGEDVGSGAPPIAGVRVSLLALDFAELDSTTTDAEGRYTLTAPRDTLSLHLTDPTDDYLGSIRGEAGRTMDYEAYDVHLPRRDGVVAAVAATGATYDQTRGYVIVGFNVVDEAAGGEGATLSGATHDPAFILFPGGFQVTNVLPPICGEGQTPEADGCALEGRNDQVYFPNVEGDTVRVSLVDPEGGTCTERFGVTEWPVFPDTAVSVNVDCAAL